MSIKTSKIFKNLIDLNPIRVNSPQHISTDKQSQKYHTQTFEIVYVTPEPYLNRQEEINISNEPKPVLKVSMERSREMEFFSTDLMAECHGEMVHGVIHKTFCCHSPVKADMLILTSTDTITQK